MPLRRRQPLRANVETARAWERRSRKPLPAQSMKRKGLVPRERKVRQAVIDRDGGCLLRYERDEWGPCRGPLTFQHLHKASQGGAYTKRNGVCLCWGHNVAQEQQRRLSERYGLTVTKLIDHDEAKRRRVAAGIDPAH